MSSTGWDTASVTGSMASPMRGGKGSVVVVVSGTVVVRAVVVVVTLVVVATDIDVVDDESGAVTGSDTQADANSRHATGTTCFNSEPFRRGSGRAHRRPSRFRVPEHSTRPVPHPP